MKKKDEQIDQQVKRTLDSIDYIQRVEGNPFLFTRIQEAIRSEEEIKDTSGPIQGWGTISRVGIALVVMLCIANIYTLINYSNSSSTDDISVLSDAYGWNENASMGIYDSIEFE